jgi:hypothetical protein
MLKRSVAMQALDNRIVPARHFPIGFKSTFNAQPT